MGAFTDVSPTVFSTASKRCDECFISNKVDILCKQASVLDSDKRKDSDLLIKPPSALNLNSDLPGASTSAPSNYVL